MSGYYNIIQLFSDAFPVLSMGFDFSKILVVCRELLSCIYEYGHYTYKL